MDIVIGLVIGLVLGAALGALVVQSRAAAASATAAGLREQVDALHAEARRAAQVDAEEGLVLQALAPVHETLRTMQKTVSDLEQQRHAQHGQLAEQLRHTQATAERSREAAEALASAMSNNSTRGVWGETQLRTLVESAGLLNRVDFDTQTTITAETGQRRPDMVLRLPGGKCMAVDAKAPLTAYLQASGDGVVDRDGLLTEHARAVRAHVDALAAKQYWTGLETSPEFTIAFIPSEPVLAAALERDPALLEHAFARRIVLASPVSLWAVLKTVALTWQQQALSDDARQLLTVGKELYGRLSTMSDHADKLRRSLTTTVESYNRFASSLESRVLVTARKLDVLDESTVIGTPGLVDVEPKALVQPELVPGELGR
ncbi:DNA recombination protein RmuC [Aeromicrobium sp. Leaf350]|uniref:DNA recombination protein RmuC n=1 Tax=Aeromicrobium sp. Leaf350 TaxID=2876565 RepID=UPI001E29A9E7|nr:DNA recombination protein RmuC [Aeromicrobium sp. Leaf350]